MSDESPLKVFRNTSQSRKFYLRSRDADHPERNFELLPGRTVRALDAAEEKLLSSVGDIIDVEKESPQIADAMSGLRAELEEARRLNASLKAENAALAADAGRAAAAPAELPAPSEAVAAEPPAEPMPEREVSEPGRKKGRKG